MRMMARNSISESLQARIDGAVKEIATDAYDVALKVMHGEQGGLRQDRRGADGEGDHGRGRVQGESCRGMRPSRPAHLEAVEKQKMPAKSLVA